MRTSLAFILPFMVSLFFLPLSAVSQARGGYEVKRTLIAPAGVSYFFQMAMDDGSILFREQASDASVRLVLWDTAGNLNEYMPEVSIRDGLGGSSVLSFVEGIEEAVSFVGSDTVGQVKLYVVTTSGKSFEFTPEEVGADISSQSFIPYAIYPGSKVLYVVTDSTSEYQLKLNGDEIFSASRFPGVTFAFEDEVFVGDNCAVCEDKITSVFIDIETFERRDGSQYIPNLIPDNGLELLSVDEQEWRFTRTSITGKSKKRRKATLSFLSHPYNNPLGLIETNSIEIKKVDKVVQVSAEATDGSLILLGAGRTKRLKSTKKFPSTFALYQAGVATPLDTLISAKDRKQAVGNATLRPVTFVGDAILATRYPNFTTQTSFVLLTRK